MAFLVEQIVSILSERPRVRTLTELLQDELGDSTEESPSITEKELSDNSNVEQLPNYVAEATDLEVTAELVDVIAIETLENE